MRVNIQELSTKPPNASGLLYTLIWLDVRPTSPCPPPPPPLPVIENRWRNNNRFYIFQCCGIALNYERLGGKEGIVLSVTLLTCPRLVFNAVAARSVPTTRRKITIFCTLHAQRRRMTKQMTERKRTCKEWGETQFACWTFPPQTQKLVRLFVEWFCYLWLVCVTFSWNFFGEGGGGAEEMYKCLLCC